VSHLHITIQFFLSQSVQAALNIPSIQPWPSRPNDARTAGPGSSKLAVTRLSPWAWIYVWQ